MKYLAEMVRDIKKVINEAGDEEEVLLITEDKVNLDLYIEEALSSSVLFFQRNMPATTINMKAALSGERAGAEGMDCHVIDVPEDYVRLVRLKMKSWRRACVTTFPVGGEEWKRQQNPHTRAKLWKPVCIEDVNNKGKRVLRCYGVGYQDGGTIDDFVYEAKFNVEEGLNVTDENLYKAILYKAASLVYAIYQDSQSSALLEREAYKMIGLNMNSGET